MDDFGKILESDEAIDYLKRTKNPRFEVAFRTAGGDEDEVIKLIEQAADNIELALSRAHFYKSSTKLQKVVKRLGIDATQLLLSFLIFVKKYWRIEVNACIANQRYCHIKCKP